MQPDGRQTARRFGQARRAGSRTGGFVIERIAGSHHLLVYPGDASRAVTVPVHGNRDLKPGTLRSIIRQAGFTVEQVIELL